ncbi:hypothetical protein KHQ81_13005 [Mycoplasmatota bacterium]|nr:hypothetical protein KHQ81_13005 [Mycoplasmatota bacterium]
MNELKHKYTNEIVCPYCGYEFSDSWEFDGDEDLGLIECEECDKSFYATRDIEITYSTQKAKYGTCKVCGAKEVVLENYCSSMGNHDHMCLRCGEKEKQKLRKKYFEELESYKEEKK